jgi:hypothetical protein
MKRIRCINHKKNDKYFTGIICSNLVSVGDLAEEAVCWSCLVRKLGNPTPPINDVKKDGYPRGWKFKVVFVHKDGTVYHKGVEQPELKGTLDPTEIPKKKQVQSKEKKQIDFKKIKDFKTKIKKENDIKKKKRIEKKLKDYLKEF